MLRARGLGHLGPKELLVIARNARSRTVSLRRRCARTSCSPDRDIHLVGRPIAAIGETASVPRLYHLLARKLIDRTSRPQAALLHRDAHMDIRRSIDPAAR